MVGGADDSSSITYNVSLVAASGREQGVVLRIRRDGLWLYTEGGKVMLFSGVGPELVYCIVACCLVQQLCHAHLPSYGQEGCRSRDCKVITIYHHAGNPAAPLSAHSEMAPEQTPIQGPRAG